VTVPAGHGGRWRWPILAGVVVLVLDQLTKWWALEVLDGRTIDLVWTLRLHLVHNSGAAFGRGQGWGPLLAVLVLAVVAVLVRMAATSHDDLARVVVGGVVGGAMGNLADRVFRADDGPLSGAVVDMVDLQWWPVFNLADAVIVVGGIVVVLRGRRIS